MYIYEYTIRQCYKALQNLSCLNITKVLLYIKGWTALLYEDTLLYFINKHT